MRRSAAPSQTAKRAKFNAPLQALQNPNPAMRDQTDGLDCKDRSFDAQQKEAPIFYQKDAEIAKDRCQRLSQCSSDDNSTWNDYVSINRSSSQVVKIIQNHSICQKGASSATPKHRSELARTISNIPEMRLPNISCPDAEQLKSISLSVGDVRESPSKYFVVMISKPSKRKNKIWEDDGSLQCSDNTVSLFNHKGIKIGSVRSTDPIHEGMEKMVCGKSILVSEEISKEQFRSKCNGNELCDQPSECKSDFNSQPSDMRRKDFLRATRGVLVKPLFEPTAPGALVMPRMDGRSLDVVVDPHISIHLRQHQIEGIIFLYRCVMGMNGNFLGAVLADEMGLGKTLQCIGLIWTLLKQGPTGCPVLRQALIVVPGSLVHNWENEFKKWLGPERLRVFAISQDKKIDDFLVGSIYKVLVISYEMFARNAEQLATVNFGLVVCDEAHRLKNNCTQLAKSLRTVGTNRRIALTATPIQNDLLEFFSLVEFINPGLLPDKVSFRREYSALIGSASLEGDNKLTQLKQLMNSFILRRTANQFSSHLPPKIEFVLMCSPTQRQLDLYRQVSQTDESLAGLSALRNICNHPTVDADEEPCNVNCKLKVLREILLSVRNIDPTERMVVVAGHLESLNLIENCCHELSLETLRLDGSTAISARQSSIESFNKRYGKHTVFLLSTRAGGTGLNLVGASRLILFDIDWNPASDVQAMARIWRDGQKNKVYIYRLLVAGTIEERMFVRQQNKLALSGMVIDETESAAVDLSAQELSQLMQLDCTNSFTHKTLMPTCDCQKASTVCHKLEGSEYVCDWHHQNSSDQLGCLDSSISAADLSSVSFAFWNFYNQKCQFCHSGDASADLVAC